MGYKMIIHIPIEPIPMRYSVDWYDWFFNYFQDNGIYFASVNGEELTKGIEQGRFLDCIGTNYYKSSQLMIIMKSIQEGKINTGDVLFFHDLWFPGIEQIKYTCDALGLNVKIMGCLHAGAYDPNDMLYQKGMGSWAIHFEHMLFSLVDKIFVATAYHSDLLLKSRACDKAKIKITGFPFIAKSHKAEKKNQIVFPHRKDSEKNPHLFLSLKAECQNIFPKWDWVFTADLKDKDQYYKTLAESKIAVSFSDQETWGIAMQEAVIAGCIPLVPNKLSYKEMYLNIYKYDTIFGAKEKLIDMVIEDSFPESVYKKRLSNQKKSFLEVGSKAFENIVSELGY